MPESMSSLSLNRGLTTSNDTFAFHFAFGCLNPMTRVPFELLGPCFKTGQITNVDHWWRDARLLYHTHRKKEWTDSQTKQAHSTNASHSCHTAKLRHQQSPVHNFALGADWYAPMRQRHSFSMIECALVHRSSSYADSERSSEWTAHTHRIATPDLLLIDTSHNNTVICFTQYGFTHCWTLSSEFFSTFPHGTCSLLVPSYI